jgi:nucleotidyltransferase substrate binding protein (TIGR01987 family)
MTSSDIQLRDFGAALDALDRALREVPNEFVRDSAIQRFEFCFELSWKIGQKFLQHFGVVATSPRAVVLEMAQQGWISSADAWLKFLDDRNLSVHTYREALAQSIFERLPVFRDAGRALHAKFMKLKA